MPNAALQLGPQCCCSGVGIVSTAYATFHLYHHEDSSGQPCWAMKPDVEPISLFGTRGFKDSSRWVVGFDHGTNEVISIGSGYNIDELGFPAPPEVVGGLFADLDNCGREGTGRSTTVERFDADATEGILESAGSGSHFCYATQDKILGLAGADVWSVDYDGENFAVDLTTPTQIWRRWFQGDNFVGQTVGGLSVNGDLISDFSAPGVGVVGGQALGFPPGDWPPGLSLLQDIDLPTIPIAYVSYEEDGVPYLGYPFLVGWDQRKDALVVLWYSGAHPTFTGIAGPGRLFFASYIKQPISAGNLIGQDGVTFYDATPTTAGPNLGDPLAGGLSTLAETHAWVIPFGEYPRPLDFTALNLPEEPEDLCAQFLDCPAEDMRKMVLGFLGFENCTTDHGGGHVEQWYWENLNTGTGDTFIPFLLEPTTDFDASVIFCIAQTKTNFWRITGDYVTGGGSPTAEDWLERYSDPGILHYTNTHAESFIDEIYICAIGAVTECINGFVYVREIAFLRHSFQFLWDAIEEDWDRTVVNAYSLLGIGCDEYTRIDDDTYTGAWAGRCITPGPKMESTYDYSKCGDTRQFTSRATVGVLGE